VEGKADDTRGTDAVGATGCENDTIRVLLALWQREAMIVFGATAPHEKAYVHFLSGKAKGR
jgi:hypothetical protein